MVKKLIQVNSLSQQVDDWMLLKITEKIIQENAFEQKKKRPRFEFNPGLSSNWPSKKWAQGGVRHCESQVSCSSTQHNNLSRA